MGMEVVTIGGAVRENVDFAAFARERGDRMLRTAWLVTRNHEDARDAVQDALLGLYRSRDRLPSDDALDAYVHRSVVNASLRVIARRPRTIAVAEVEQVPGSSGDHADEVAEADVVWRLCGDLGPTQRAAVVLRFYADLDYAGVAAALSCREATARSHVHRAIARLRSRLEEERDGR